MERSIYSPQIENNVRDKNSKNKAVLLNCGEILLPREDSELESSFSEIGKDLREA
jgi:hypothetical protein